jgi:hypothetical protein
MGLDLLAALVPTCSEISFVALGKYNKHNNNADNIHDKSDKLKEVGTREKTAQH